MKLPKKMNRIIKDVLENLNGFEDYVKNVGVEYYMDDRFVWLKQPHNQDDINKHIYDTDVETITTLLIQMYYKYIIMNDDNGKDIRRIKPIQEIK